MAGEGGEKEGERRIYNTSLQTWMFRGPPTDGSAILLTALLKLI